MAVPADVNRHTGVMADAVIFGQKPGYCAATLCPGWKIFPKA